jgi:hypothetical protein
MTDHVSDEELWAGLKARLAIVERFRRPVPDWARWRESAARTTLGGGRAVTGQSVVATTTVVAAAVVLVVALGLRANTGSGATTSSSQTGIQGTIEISGGPPPGHHGGTATLTVLAGDRVISTRLVTSGNQVVIELAAGQYLLTASYGNSGCDRTTVTVVRGALAPFELVCSIR